MLKKFWVLMAFLALLLVSYQETTEEDDETNKKTVISGYWKSSYGDGFDISGTTYSQYDDSSKTVSFAGTIVNDPDLTASSNYIIIKVTNGGTWGKTVNNYYALPYKDLTATTIKESSAYKTGGQSEMTTQAGAESEFTIANGYFSYYGDYIKQ